jgi:lipoprotein-anchoring transpeptidase ErfK/SrfK
MARRWAAGMPGRADNPLGARALYLYQGDRDTLYRIHGTAEVWSIGRAVSSGCIRLLNADVIDLYNRVPTGTRVVVRRSRGVIASDVIEELEQG